PPIAQTRDHGNEPIVLRMERARRAAAFWPATMPQQSKWSRWLEDHADALRTVSGIVAVSAIGTCIALALGSLQ
ncbi:MAG TPA: hypothetical protein VII48_13750, partial [Rhizomicrobium sp.]